MNVMAARWCKLYEGTEAEHSLEDAVAAIGVPYRTQYPGWRHGCRFFPDFYLPTLKLVIEVDDKSHNDVEKIIADAERSDKIMAVWGASVVRCTNDEAVADPHGTVRRLLVESGLWPLPTRLPRMADSLPPLQRAAAKNRREAKSVVRRAKRQARIVRRSRSAKSARGHSSPRSTRQALIEAPTLGPTGLALP